MKAKELPPKPAEAQPAARPMPRVAAVRRIVPDRPGRVWSLLLPPNLDK